MTTIDNNNYELWLLRYAEGELSAAERAEVEAWLESHPEAAEELALYDEAPRLEKDESVRYVAAARQHVQPLWPLVARWSAAAAVVVVLMLPAMRMGGMDAAEGPMVAKGIERIDEIETVDGIEKIEAIEKRDVLLVESMEAINSVKSIPSIESIASIDSTPSPAEEAPLQPEIIPVNTLIAFEEDTPSYTQTQYTDDLIVYDNSTDWGDLLLATNSMLREGLSSSTLGSLAMRTLPDNESLEQSVVNPIREKISNLRNKRK